MYSQNKNKLDEITQAKACYCMVQFHKLCESIISVVESRLCSAKFCAIGNSSYIMCTLSLNSWCSSFVKGNFYI